MDNLSDKDKLSDKRMAKEQVKKLLARILSNGGEIRFTEYCEKRMLERGITTPTIINVLRRGIVLDYDKKMHQVRTSWAEQHEPDSISL
jgi:hypothetical protein